MKNQQSNRTHTQTSPNTGAANQPINPCTAHTGAAACSQPNSCQMRKEREDNPVKSIGELRTLEKHSGDGGTN